MPQYFSPGVYVEEIDAGPRPIQGVSTSIAGMVGVTVRGPTTGKPQLVTSFFEFQRRFGGFLPDPDEQLRNRWQDPSPNNVEGGRWWLLPHAVRAFFDNGGQQLYVKRVAAGSATRSSVVFQGGLISDIMRNAAPDPAAANETELELEHLVGIDATPQRPITVVWRDGGSPATQSVQVSAYDAARRRITVTPRLQRAVRAGRDFIQIKAPQAPTTLTVTAAAPGGWGDGVTVRVTPQMTTIGLLPDPGEGDAFVTQVAAPAAQNSPTVIVRAVPGLSAGPPPVPATPFFVQIGDRPRRFEVSGVQAVAGQADQLELALQGGPQHAAWSVNLPVRRVRRANPAGAGTNLRVQGAGTLYPNAVVELDNGTTKQTLLVNAVQGDTVTFGANAAAGYFEGDKVHLIEARLQATYTDELGGVTDEAFGNLHLQRRDASGGPDELAAETRINGNSQLVMVEQPIDLNVTADLRLPVPANVGTGGSTAGLGGGQDRFDTLTVADFVGQDRGSGQRTGIVSLEDIDAVAIVAVPGMWSGTIQSALITHCETLKDRFAILDPPDPASIERIQEFRAPIDTKYAALYYPWLIIRDPVPTADRDLTVPPSGHLAGIYARVDTERGVHKAPANVVIRGINVPAGIAQDVTKREQDVLNPVGINVLRAFPNLGQRVWGARTLSSDTTWKYINVRRLFIFVEESLDEGLQWVVFEPNDDPLWALVRQTITTFLTGLWRNGQLAGATPDEAFFVTCDRTTMTPDDLANGRLICLVGIAPVFPAEFVIIRIQQKTREFQRA
jgi:phage tail sheath protein FI